VPSTTTPSKPYASARSATCSVANSRYVGVEYAHWLLSQTKTTGSLRTPASVIASWQSPRADAPSPNQPTATRFSSRMRKASAQPTATGSIAGRWLTIAISPRLESAMWTLPSLPFVGPSERPMYCAKTRHGSTPRTMWTPMSRWSGVPTSSGPIAVATPTEAASLPRPV
jgi:hypothetical protein